MRDLLAGPVELDRGPGQADGAALGPVDVQSFSAGDPADLVDRVVHGVLHRLGVPARAVVRAILSSEAGNSAEHQPPLRPLAPNPATFASTMAMRVPGAALAR